MTRPFFFEIIFICLRWLIILSETISDVNVSEQERMIVKLEKNGIVSNEWVEVPEEKKSVQKLSGKQLVELAKICKTIEKHYASPQDIEWAFEKGKFYIVQARPVTTI